MPSHGVFHHLEEHRAVAGGADLELVQQLNCGSTFGVSCYVLCSVPFGSVWFGSVSMF